MMTNYVRAVFMLPLLVLASTAVAQEQPAPRSQDGPAAGLVDVLGGVTVWSAPADGGYALMARSAAGVVRLPVRPRAVPFDVDLGPEANGGIVAVYSRCSTEPIGSRAALVSSRAIYYGYERVRGLTGGARPGRSASSRVFRQQVPSGRRVSVAAPPLLTGFGIDGTTAAYGVSADPEQYFIPRGSVIVDRAPDWGR
jgi:hypothetical protein